MTAETHRDHADYQPRDWQRFYLGYKERFVDDCCIPLDSCGLTVRLMQAPSVRAAGKKCENHRKEIDRRSDPALTGTTVWDGAVVLSQYLTRSGVLKNHSHQWAHGLPVAVELGAGTGAVSLCLLAAQQVHQVVITDLPDMLPSLQQNLRHNMGILDVSRASIRPLRWSNDDDITRLTSAHERLDLIVGSDLIYYTYSDATPHSALLLQTLCKLASPETLIFLALSLHHNPDEVHHFLQRSSEHFLVERVSQGIPEEYRVPDVMVVRLMKKPLGLME